MMIMAEPTGLEPATSNVTGLYSTCQKRVKYACFQALSKTQQLGFDLVALFMRSILGTFWGTVDEKEKSHLDDDSKTPGFIDDNGGADGTRTRDLQRDRLAF